MSERLDRNPADSVHHPSLSAGADIGGTFTDLIVLERDTGKFAVGKTLTIPGDPSRAVESALLETLRQMKAEPRYLAEIAHGTTLVTNALIERRGDRTALLATQGFRDSVEIGRENRYDLYDLMIDLPRPLVPRCLRFEVPQRTLSDGSALRDPDTAYIERLAQELAASSVTAMAICFLNSYANPEAERAAREAVRRVAPGMRVSISSEVSPVIREFERASTTIANVYVQSQVDSYLGLLQERLERLGFSGSLLLMTSNGGAATPGTAIRFPIRLLESGPAAGALAAAAYGAACGRPDLVSFDMGGTTAKFCVIEDARPLIAHQFEFDRVYRFKKGSGLPAGIPVIEMVEIGAGGGSIARVNSLGLLTVGPDSAGADPGPACYGRGGTEPTVTDADLVLGYLDPAFFLGGRMPLDTEAARTAIEHRVARRLGSSVEAAAWAIHRLVNENMANAARIHVLERGQAPQSLPVFAFGGAGPVHGFRIAQALGAPALIAPFGAGILSTIGLLSAPIAFDFVRSWRARLDFLDWDRGSKLLQEMEAEGSELLRRSNVPSEEIVVEREAEMRYVGQGHEIGVPLPNGLLGARHVAQVQASFEARYRQLFGRLGPPVPLEIVNWRVLARGPSPKVHLGHFGQENCSDPVKGARSAFFPELEGFVSVLVYDRYRMGHGFSFEGPAIVEERESTLIVGPGGVGRIDSNRNLIVTIS